jgi:hypothetical protein
VTSEQRRLRSKWQSSERGKEGTGSHKDSSGKGEAATGEAAPAYSRGRVCLLPPSSFPLCLSVPFPPLCLLSFPLCSLAAAGRCCPLLAFAVAVGLFGALLWRSCRTLWRTIQRKILSHLSAHCANQNTGKKQQNQISITMGTKAANEAGTRAKSRLMINQQLPWARPQCPSRSLCLGVVPVPCSDSLCFLFPPAFVFLCVPCAFRLPR